MFYINDDMINTTINKKEPQKVNTTENKKKVQSQWFSLAIGIISLNIGVWSLPITLLEKCFILTSVALTSISILTIKK